MKKTTETAVSKPILTQKNEPKLASADKPVLAQLREMEVGDVLIFPAERRSSVKSMCSEFGFEWDKKFSTSINRKEKVISVTRKA